MGINLWLNSMLRSKAVNANQMFYVSIFCVKTCLIRCLNTKKWKIVQVCNCLEIIFLESDFGGESSFACVCSTVSHGDVL